MSLSLKISLCFWFVLSASLATYGIYRNDMSEDVSKFYALKVDEISMILSAKYAERHDSISNIVERDTNLICFFSPEVSVVNDQHLLDLSSLNDHTGKSLLMNYTKIINNNGQQYRIEFRTYKIIKPFNGKQRLHYVSLQDDCCRGDIMNIRFID